MRSTAGRLVAIVAVLALAAVGCGNADDTDDDATDTSGADDPGTAGGPSTTADLTAFVPSEEPGVTDDTIRVGGVASVTNPLGGSYGDAFAGTKAYFEMINSEGGIYGRQLELVAERDDQVSQNQAEVQAILAQDDVFAVLPVATLLFQGATDLADAGVPTFGWNINPEWLGPENLFGEKGSTICFTCPRPGWPWVARELGRTNVAILGYGVSDQSKECAQGARASFEKYGGDVVFYDDTLPFGVPDLSGEVSEMKDADANFVMTCMDQNGVVTLQREIERQDLDAIQYLSNAYDAAFVEEFGDLFEGSLVGIQFWPFEETDDQPEGMLDYLEWMEATGGSVNELSMAGWTAADLFVEGLKAAGPEFTQQGLIDAINGMTDWDANGLNPGFDWTRVHEQEMPDDCFALLRIEDGAFVQAFGEPGRPFMCQDGEADELPDEVEFRN
jgi:ABC-type branched-subunit amino acid transport system substrate-binding protein